MSFLIVFVGLISYIFYKKYLILDEPSREEFRKNLKKNIRLKFKYGVFYSKLALKVGYYLMLQKLNKSVIQIDKTTYEITYLLKNKLYKFRTKVLRGPVNAVVEILGSNSCEGEEQVFEEAKEIEPYLGPNLNFHNTFYTPADFGYKKLIFVLEDGTEQTFSDKEMITLMV
jgi:hypothetical protein